jgi:hypothetical protein
MSDVTCDKCHVVLADDLASGPNYFFPLVLNTTFQGRVPSQHLAQNQGWW